MDEDEFPGQVDKLYSFFFHMSGTDLNTGRRTKPTWVVEAKNGKEAYKICLDAYKKKYPEKEWYVTDMKRI